MEREEEKASGDFPTCRVVAAKRARAFPADLAQIDDLPLGDRELILSVLDTEAKHIPCSPAAHSSPRTPR